MGNLKIGGLAALDQWFSSHNLGITNLGGGRILGIVSGDTLVTILGGGRAPNWWGVAEKTNRQSGGGSITKLIGSRITKLGGVPPNWVEV
jgi:hypothetical protein